MLVCNVIILFCNIIMLFCIIIIFFCVLKCHFIIVRMLFFIITMLFCVLLCSYVMTLPCLVYQNDVLCTIILFCIIIILSVCPNIVSCLFMLHYTATMLQYYYLSYNLMSYLVILLFCV